MALNMKRHDTRTAIKAKLKSPKGLPIDLTGATVKFTMAKYATGTTLINREAEVLDAAGGSICFVFLPEETVTLGTMKAEFEVTHLDGSIEKFPNQGYIIINFESDLA